MLYRRRVEDMPADSEEIHGAYEEGVQIIPQTIPVEIIGEGGKVKSIQYLMAEMVPDEKGGRPKPVPIEGSEQVLEIDTLIGAIGQEADYGFLPQEYLDKIETNRGRMLVDNNNKTTLDKVYAGGDAVNKTADAISAIADGHRAADAIERMLLV